ncbi:MAG: hypothetical protein J6P45_02040 [Lachnospiraceae bacterium]|nr:hypothetical protein [Lachnospiraceae bacterium]MBR1876307.1 hypothetical protein [Lachnospiraceae bacterium]
MDNFMDRLVEKINMQNSRAGRDREENEEIYRNTKTEIESFKNTTHEDLESIRSDIKELSGTRDLINDSTEKLISEIREQKQSALDDVKNSVSDIIHKEDVKLYRNVQAVVSDENKKMTEKLDALDKSMDRTAEFEKVNSRLEDIESVEGVVAGRTSGLKNLLIAVIILLALNLSGIGVIIAHLFGVF